MDSIGTEYSSSELYDPATGIWTQTGSLAKARMWHTATLLPSGKVLVAGGNNWGEYLSSAELYDPVTGTWTATASMGSIRIWHTTVLLQNGQVLVAGGVNGDLLGDGRPIASAELYTPTQELQRQSNSAQDGWVLETGETSNQGGALNAAAATFILGDTANRQQYRSILSFNTRPLPDNAVMTRVVLKIKKHSLTGDDPFATLGKIAIDIRRGAFSQNADLQPPDFQAAESKAAVGLIANTPQPGGWYSARLIAAAYPFINRTGVTQLRLRFKIDDDDDAIADLLRFYSGDAAAPSRPVLVVEYYVP
jgi:hypothetical protein